VIFDGRPIDEIKDEEFDTLIQEGTSERQHLEFKEIYKIKDPEDKLEVLRDIASLANGGGGYLIIGMQDDGTGKPVGYRPQSREDLDKMKKSIQQLCLDHIAERIPRLEFRIREPNNKPILIIYIPDSIQAPHMVKFNRRTDFYTRYDEGKREMSIAEIRRAFQDDRMQLMLDSISHKTDDILRCLPSEGAAEVTEVSGGEPTKETGVLGEEPGEVKVTPFFPSAFSDGYKLIQAVYNRMMAEIDGEPYFWIAVTPILLNRDALNVDSTEIREIITTPPGSRRSGWNMERTVNINNIPDGIGRGPKDYEYLLLYKNAHMEFRTPLNEHFCWRQKPEEFSKSPELYPYPVVEYPVTFLRLHQAIIESSRIQGEFIVNLRYVNLKGYRLRPYGPKQVGYMFADEVKPFTYNHLILPPLKIGHSSNPDETAYKLLEQVYSAFELSAKTIPFWTGNNFDFPS